MAFAVQVQVAESADSKSLSRVVHGFPPSRLSSRSPEPAMHFGKTFEQLLATLPDEYQKQAIDYKKVRNADFTGTV